MTRIKSFMGILLFFSAPLYASRFTNYPIPFLNRYVLTDQEPLSERNVHQFRVSEKNKALEVQRFCQKLDAYFKKYKWNPQPCGAIEWEVDFKTPGGNPLIYTVFGSGKGTTLILSGVHPDELTPIPLAFRFAQHLKEHPEIFKNKEVKVIVAPLANPDGFFLENPTRTNGNGVDINRNFYTTDWYEKAKAWWQSSGKNRKERYYPGDFPNTEIETYFQSHLISQLKPDKILSLHAPLGFLDYDGPGDRKPRQLSDMEKQAKRFVYAVAKKSNYKVVDYSFYPGSLGNYAGNERHIPTLTLELETTDPAKSNEYWSQFLPGMIQSIHFPFRRVSFR